MRSMEPDKSTSDAAPARRPRCPICGADASPTDEAFPFCSSRCRLADLGRWLGGQYVVSREIRAEDLDEA